MSRRARTGLAGVLVGLALLPLVLSLRGGAGSVRASDFTVVYTGATLIRQGQPAAVYDQRRLGPALLRASEGRIDPQLPFDYPLADALPMVPLTLLPLQAAFRVWQVAILGLLALAIVVLGRILPLGKSARGWGLLAILAAEPTWALLTEGQLGGLLLVGAVAILAATARDRPGWGLLGGALLAVKPQYLPAFLAVLVAARCWRSLLAASAAGVAVACSALLVGWSAGLVAMVRAALSAGVATDLRTMDSWAAILALALPARAAVAGSLALLAAALVGLVVLAALGRIDPLPFAALAGCFALLASPHTLPHDLVLLAVPAWAAFALSRQGRLSSPLAGLALVQAALILDLRGLPVSLGAFALTAVLGWYVLDFRRRAAATPRLAAAA